MFQALFSGKVGLTSERTLFSKLKLFVKDTLMTLGTRVIVLALNIFISIAIARGLGPEGKGIYTLVTLFPALIFVFANLGIGPATVYYVAQQKYPLKVVLGTNTILTFVIGAIFGLIAGILALVFQQSIFPEVPRAYLLIALLLFPLELFRQQAGGIILLGAKRIRELSLTSVVYDVFFLALIFLVFKFAGTRVMGIVGARIVSSVFVCVWTFALVARIAGGIEFRPHRAYLKDLFGYGIQAYLGNVISFLNYRIELLLLSMFMSADTIGFYSIALNLAEQLWLVSQSAATMIFPMVSAEKDPEKLRAFTPLINRSVTLITALGALLLALLSRVLVTLMYTDVYLPTVGLLRILLIGIVLNSSTRILANDLAGRGKPMLNTLVGGISLAIQVILNLILIPRFGAAGSAWSTTIAYALVFLMQLALYMKIAKVPFGKVILPQRADWQLYRQLTIIVLQWIRLRLVRLRILPSHNE
ncbi:MAG: oligosaccharide flippase family protein [Anaerolineae bacterium]|nr:oligosaccharide flippase family protein [Anaerolineae bacterium]